MESLEDLEVGKVIQETFFPSKPLETNGWSAFGASRSTARVGGAYFDYLSLPDGRMLIFTGNAAGNGVSEGLIVAMVKAVFSYPAVEKSPSILLDRLNAVLASTLNKRWTMSCCVVLFDPVTRAIDIATAGDSRPILVRENSCERIGMLNDQAGAWKKPCDSLPSFVLGNEDWLCFPAHSSPNSPSETGTNPLPEIIQRQLPLQKKLNAKETHASLLEWFSSLSVDGWREEEVTMVILQRISPPPCGFQPSQDSSALFYL